MKKIHGYPHNGYPTDMGTGRIFMERVGYGRATTRTLPAPLTSLRVRNDYNLWKTKKTMRRKIKITLINIWFNYSFDSCFRLKMLSWSFSYLLNFVSIFKKRMQFGLLRYISLNLLKQIHNFFIKIETLSMDNLICWCN